MRVFAIGDLHLSFDERIEKPMDIFGDKWNDHAAKLHKNWNQVVTPQDFVIVAGDISWGLRLEEAMADLDWIEALPGKKIMFKGNHDLWWTSIGKLNALYDDMFFVQNHCCFIDDRTAVCGTRGWICPGTDGFDQHDEKIYSRELLRLEMSLKEAKTAGTEKIICCLHFPPTNDKHQPSGFSEMMSAYGVKKCVYGHLHGKDAFKNGIKGVLNGVDYALVSLDSVDGMPLEIEI